MFATLVRLLDDPKEGRISREAQLRHAFTAFHLCLGLALLWGSVHTVLHLGPTDLHARVIGSVGAVVFLLPRTLRPAGVTPAQQPT